MAKALNQTKNFQEPYAPGVINKDNFVGLWHVEFDGGNFLQTLTKTSSGEMEIDYRFRYYKDDKIGPDSKDERRFYSWKKPGATLAEDLETCRAVAAQVAETTKAVVSEILMDKTGFDGVLAKMERHPAFHFGPVERKRGKAARVSNTGPQAITMEATQ